MVWYFDIQPKKNYTEAKNWYLIESMLVLLIDAMNHVIQSPIISKYYIRFASCHHTVSYSLVLISISTEKGSGKCRNGNERIEIIKLNYNVWYVVRACLLDVCVCVKHPSALPTAFARSNVRVRGKTKKIHGQSQKTTTVLGTIRRSLSADKQRSIFSSLCWAGLLLFYPRVMWATRGWTCIQRPYISCQFLVYMDLNLGISLRGDESNRNLCTCIWT